MIRTFAGLCALALALGAAACGDDEERTAATAPAATTPTTATEPADTVTATAPEAETEPSGEATSPEDQPGGAGDEEAARSEAVFTFSADGLSPREVRVPPFIAVVLIVRSGDGTEYDLTYRAPSSGGGANGNTESDFEIDGLRPGQEIEITERNTDSTARVVASDAVGP